MNASALKLYYVQEWVSDWVCGVWAPQRDGFSTVPTILALKKALKSQNGGHGHVLGLMQESWGQRFKTLLETCHGTKFSPLLSTLVQQTCIVCHIWQRNWSWTKEKHGLPKVTCCGYDSVEIWTGNFACHLLRHKATVALNDIIVSNQLWNYFTGSRRRMVLFPP